MPVRCGDGLRLAASALEARQNARIINPASCKQSRDLPHTRATLRLEPPEDMPVLRAFSWEAVHRRAAPYTHICVPSAVAGSSSRRPERGSINTMRAQSVTGVGR